MLTWLLFMVAAHAAPNLSEMHQAGGMLDQLVWLEDALPQVTDEVDREGLVRVQEALVLLVEEVSAGDAPSDWPEVAALLADPTTQDRGERFLRTLLLDALPQEVGEQERPASKYQDRHLEVLHPDLSYMIWMVHTDTMTGYRWGEITQIHVNRVFVVDGTGRELDGAVLRERLEDALGEDPGRLSRRRMTRQEDELRAQVDRYNEALARSLGLGELARTTAIASEMSHHWSVGMAPCPRDPWAQMSGKPSIDPPSFMHSYPRLGLACRVVEGPVDRSLEADPPAR